MFRAETDPAILEIGDHRVKLAQAQTLRGKKILRLVASSPLPASGEEAISQTLRKLFENNSIASRRVILNAPRYQTITKFFKLPSVDEKEVYSMARMEALRQLPYDEEDVVQDFRIIEKMEDGYSMVLSTAILKTTVEYYIQILQAAGLSIEKITLSSESLFLWFTLNYPTAQSKNILLADIDSNRLDIDIIENGKLVFTRGVLLHLNQTPEEEAIVDDILVSVETYQHQSAKPLDEIYLCGPNEKMKGYAARLAEHWKSPIHVADPLQNMPAARQSAYLEAEDASFAGAIGLCSKHSGVHINLLPRELLAENRLLSLKKGLLLSVLCVLVIFFSALGLLTSGLHDKKDLVSRIQHQMKKSETRVNAIKKMMENISFIKEEINVRPLAIDVFAEIHRITPEGVDLNFFDYEAGKLLTLRGNASQLAQVFDYSKILEKSAFFKNVKVRYATKRTTGATETVDFEINGFISKV